MVSDKVMSRVRKCYELIENGMSKRNAYLEAHIDQDTYNKYKHLISPENPINIGDIKTIENIYNPLNRDNGGKVKRRPGRPKMEEKKERIYFYLEPKYFNILNNEAKEEHLAIGTYVRQRIIKDLKTRHKDLK